MKYRVLVSAPYMQPVLDRFREEFTQRGVELVVPRVQERLEEGDLLPLVSDVHGVICGDDRFSERVLASAPRLRVIAKWGTGIDSIDLAACARHGIEVRNTPGAFTEPVADSVLGYLLAFARRQPWMDRAMKQGVWDKSPGHTLAEKTLGIIGVGAIGKAVAKRARVFGMRILGNDPVDMPESFLRDTGTDMVDKATLFIESDYISLNCDLNPTSRHLLGDREFASMQRKPVVINTARGPIIDEPALVRALESGQLSGAGLDVFEHEPLPMDSPLRKMDSVLLAPHNSNSSPVAWERVHRNTIDNLMAVLEGDE
jgi:D-3-phosphoglycerate dehydrogenase